MGRWTWSGWPARPISARGSFAAGVWKRAAWRPNILCRVLRFRHAWSLAEQAAGRDWSGIAAEAGYFDQPHLIRDFGELAGGPPMSVFSNTAAGLNR